MSRPEWAPSPDLRDADKLSEPLRIALEADKQEGLRLSAMARFIALAVIAVFLVYMIPRWSVLYYEALVLGFALIGWLQLRFGRLGVSRLELLILGCDLALMTVTLVVPNPFETFDWPAAMQYRFSSFPYFYVLLAGATLAYSWRTVVAVGI